MGVGIVNPEEKRSAAVFVQPGENPLVDLARRQIPALRGKAVLILLETLFQTKGSTEDAQGNESRRGETLFPEEVDEGRTRLPDGDFLAVVVVPDGVGRLGKKERGVGGERDRDKAVGVPVEGPFSSQVVDAGSRCLSRLIGADIIGALGIQCD